MGKAKYSFKRKKNDFYTSRPAVDANPACTAVMSSAVCFWAAPPQIVVLWSVLCLASFLSLYKDCIKGEHRRVE